MKAVKFLFILWVGNLCMPGHSLWAQNEKPLIRFGLFADAQYADCDPNINRYYRQSLSKLEECINYLNQERVQFAINLGDIIDRDFKEIDTLLTSLKRLDHKVYHLTGNHDYKGVTDNNALYKKLNMPSEYYSMGKKKWVFIFLNTNELASYANVAGTEKEQELSALRQQIKKTGGIQGASWNGGVSAKQLEWLDKLLAKSEKAGKRVLIFAHHPLWPKSAFTALNNVEILDVVDKYSCVKAIFAGHHHAGGFAYFKNIPVVTVEGMVETTENSYGVVNIYDDRIEIDGKGRMTSRVFKKQ